jgi:hypothetical protein
MKAPRLLALALAAAALAGAGSARADAPPSASAESAKLSEAQRRFQRGVELYREGDSGAALVEFKRAYELVPSYKLLYNLGQVAYQRHDYAAALRYFRQYLGEADNSIPIERQREVAGEITELEQRVGRLMVETPESGADVFIDDVMVGTTPLRGPVLVNSGSRKVALIAGGGAHVTRVIDVAGGEIRRVSFPGFAQTAPAAPPAAATAAPPAPAGPIASPAPRAADALNLASAATQVAAAQAAAPVTTTHAAATVTAPGSGSGSARPSTFPWKAWTLTGVLAAGAAATGVIAYMNKRDLDSQLAMFPADAEEIDYYQRRTRGFALATDGLLVGAAVMAAVSLYLTYRDPK